MSLDVEDVARVIHDAIRATQIGFGEAPLPGWDDASDDDRKASICGVEDALAGGTPRSSHENWMAGKVAAGWTYGPVKDASAKAHPCLIPYDRLPVAQRVKDELIVAIVGALRPAMEA